MSLERAKNYLKKFNLEDRIIIFNESSKTVEEAAHALKCSEADIAKTMSFSLDDKNIIIVVAGDKRIDNAKYKEEFNKKAKMIQKEDVERLVGHEVGGVCPFGINEDIEIYLDVSLKDHDIVYPAAGTGNSAVKIEVGKLEEILDYKKWVDVCK